MRKTLLALAGAMALAAMPAQADSDFGIKAGLMNVESDDSAAKMVGLVYSRDLFGIVGVEFDAMMSVADGDGGGADYSARQLGAHAVLMTPGPLWFKAKAGLAHIALDVDGVGDGSKASPSYGIGIGFGLFELELTRSKGEIDTIFGTAELDTTLVTLNFKF